LQADKPTRDGITLNTREMFLSTPPAGDWCYAGSVSRLPSAPQDASDQYDFVISTDGGIPP
jgi:hypothetical protein